MAAWLKKENPAWTLPLSAPAFKLSATHKARGWNVFLAGLGPVRTVKRGVVLMGVARK